MKHLEHLVSLRLTVGAFAAYQQLKEEKEYFSQIKSALYTAFVTDGGCGGCDKPEPESSYRDSHDLAYYRHKRARLSLMLKILM